MENLTYWGEVWGKRGEESREKSAKNKNCKILRVCNNLQKNHSSRDKKIMVATVIKKGSLVRVLREQLDDSLESKASDRRFPNYLFESKGEVVDLKDEYALIRFYVPTPNVWLRLDQLQSVD